MCIYDLTLVKMHIYVIIIINMPSQSSHASSKNWTHEQSNEYDDN